MFVKRRMLQYEYSFHGAWAVMRVAVSSNDDICIVPNCSEAKLFVSFTPEPPAGRYRYRNTAILITCSFLFALMLAKYNGVLPVASPPGGPIVCLRRWYAIPRIGAICLAP